MAGGEIMRERIRSIARCAAAILWALWAAVTCAAPQTGWWWNANESGRGFFVESHDGVTFIGAYLYDTDGHALWFVAGGPNDDAYNYSGDLYNKSGGQTLFGSYVAPGNAVVVGQISVHFSDDTHGTVTWPGGIVNIERQIFGAGDAAFQPDNGWWWNPDESGSGYSLEVQGDKLFVVGFMYEASGRPVWYYSAGSMNSLTSYHGDVLQFAGGQTLAGAYQPPGTPVKVATLDIAFTAENEATTTFTDLSGAAKAVQAKASRGNKWQPQLPKKPSYNPPAKFAGYFSLNSISHDNTTPGIIYTGQLTLRMDFGWKVSTVGTLSGVPGVIYDVDYSNATIAATFDATLVSAAGTCTQTGSQTLPLGSTSIDALGVSTFRKYYLSVYIDPGSLITVTQTCNFSDGSSVTTIINVPAAGANFNYEGVVVGDTIQGGGVQTTEQTGFTQSNAYDWSFVGTGV
jgi:hypothetical protein